MLEGSGKAQKRRAAWFLGCAGDLSVMRQQGLKRTLGLSVSFFSDLRSIYSESIRAGEEGSIPIACLQMRASIFLLCPSQPHRNWTSVSTNPLSPATALRAEPLWHGEGTARVSHVTGPRDAVYGDNPGYQENSMESCVEGRVCGHSPSCAPEPRSSCHPAPPTHLVCSDSLK